MFFCKVDKKNISYTLTSFFVKTPILKIVHKVDMLVNRMKVGKIIDKSYELYIIIVQGKKVILCQLQQQN